MLIAGLIFNIVGTVLLAVFGVPQPTFNTGGTGALMMEQRDETVAAIARRKKRRHEAMSRLALVLLLVGFVFQLAEALCAQAGN